MRFIETPLAGAFVVEMERLADARGFFARSWCAREFADRGLNAALVQCNVSFNKRRGTLRGMHFQVAPHGETKLVRCTRGSIHDIIVDLRPASATYLQHFAVELTAGNRTMLYIPEGFAHGFQSLEDESEVFYQMSDYFVPACARGLRWNDPALALSWPLSDPILNDKDKAWADLPPRSHA